jgi:hypothetical protein
VAARTDLRVALGPVGIWASLDAILIGEVLDFASVVGPPRVGHVPASRTPVPGSDAAKDVMVSRLIPNCDFQKLWTADSISVLGSQISLLAIPLTAAIILKVEPLAFAMLGTIEFLPFILFTLPVGAWVDRLPRRPILIIGDLGRAVVLSTIPLAYFFGSLTIWQL